MSELDRIRSYPREVFQAAYQAHKKLALEAASLLAAPGAPDAPKAKRYSEKQIKQLIHLLGSDDFGKRTAAETALEKIGEQALPYLKVATQKVGDLEFRLRAEKVLDSIEKKVTEAKISAAKERMLAALTKEKGLDKEGKKAIRELISTLCKSDYSELGECISRNFQQFKKNEDSIKTVLGTAGLSFAFNESENPEAVSDRGDFVFSRPNGRKASITIFCVDGGTPIIGEVTVDGKKTELKSPREANTFLRELLIRTSK
jgi:hypothetical protein